MHVKLFTSFQIYLHQATYNSRPLEGDTYKKNMAAERIIVGEFGTVGYGDPCDTLFNRYVSCTGSQNCMTIIK